MVVSGRLCARFRVICPQACGARHCGAGRQFTTSHGTCLPSERDANQSPDGESRTSYPLLDPSLVSHAPFVNAKKALYGSLKKQKESFHQNRPKLPVEMATQQLAALDYSKQPSKKASKKARIFDLAARAEDPALLKRKALYGEAVQGRLFDSHGQCTLDPILLRDACECPQCVDKSTRQREFLFADIPANIKANRKDHQSDPGWSVSWENDIPGYSDHISTYHEDRIKRLARNAKHPIEDVIKSVGRTAWTRASFESGATKTTHVEFMGTDASLARVLRDLHRDGLVFLTHVPSDPDAVRSIVERIGPLRNTFYGPTWDVRSVVHANNVAYTSKYLGFHMDLLYMDYPPSFQFLHCIQNSCSGGESRFVDTWKAIKVLQSTYPQHVAPLMRQNVDFHYYNDGHHYRRTTRMLKWYTAAATIRSGSQSYPVLSWSPPFMGGIAKPSNLANPDESRDFIEASKALAEIMEREDLVYETKMEEGTCVIFDNTRVAHARNAFDTKIGQRWLKGAYLDRCDFNSRLKMLGPEIEKLQEEGQSTQSISTEQGPTTI